MDSYVQDQIARINEQVGDRSVFLLASGGVDSTVAAVLFLKALGPERLHLLHVDNGLMRKHESQQVLELFRSIGQFNARIEDALGGVRVVKAFANEEYERQLFAINNNRHRARI